MAGSQQVAQLIMDAADYLKTNLDNEEGVYESQWLDPPMEAHGLLSQDEDQSFQRRVGFWMDACFGPEIAEDLMERNHRFLEEALELVQACRCTQSEAHQLVDYVFNRPEGNRVQEVGGVKVTLAALCNAVDVNADAAAELELSRVWGKIKEIRAKQAAKPKHSPLPQHVAETAQMTALKVMQEIERIARNEIRAPGTNEDRYRTLKQIRSIAKGVIDQAFSQSEGDV